VGPFFRSFPSCCLHRGSWGTEVQLLVLCNFCELGTAHFVPNHIGFWGRWRVLLGLISRPFRRPHNAGGAPWQPGPLERRTRSPSSDRNIEPWFLATSTGWPPWVKKEESRGRNIKIRNRRGRLAASNAVIVLWGRSLVGVRRGRAGKHYSTCWGGAPPHKPLGCKSST